MALLSNREDFDKMALRRAEIAIKSTERPLMFLDALSAIDYPYPTSERELEAAFRMLDTWGIHHNLEGEPIWNELIQRGEEK